MKTAVVICPGRGTYGKAELGSLARYFKMQACWRSLMRGGWRWGRKR